jgi:hypothetical protein
MLGAPRLRGRQWEHNNGYVNGNTITATSTATSTAYVGELPYVDVNGYVFEMS